MLPLKKITALCKMFLFFRDQLYLILRPDKDQIIFHYLKIYKTEKKKSNIYFFVNLTECFPAIQSVSLSLLHLALYISLSQNFIITSRKTSIGHPSPPHATTFFFWSFNPFSGFHTRRHTACCSLPRLTPDTSLPASLTAVSISPGL